MLKLFSAFRKEKIWDFDGGIHPPEMKTQSNGTPLRQIPLATRYVMPLKQHIGAEGELCVKEGDTVLRGQPLTFGRGRMLPIHAPTSGKVVSIAPHTVAHPSALSELSVVIEADGEDRAPQREVDRQQPQCAGGAAGQRSGAPARICRPDGSPRP